MMVQMSLPFDMRRTGPRGQAKATVPAARPAPVPAPRREKPPAVQCDHERLGPPAEVRMGCDPVYGSFVIEEARCTACDATVRRTRYPELSRRPDTLPASDRTIVGTRKPRGRPALVC